MTSRHSRFLNLERSRDGRSKAEEPSQLQNGQRFEAVTAPGEALQPVVPEAHLERFKPGEAPLVLEGELSEEAQAFPRCARCESENGRFSVACGVCGADLNSPEQREYNARHAEERQAQAAREREAQRKHLEAQLEARRREADQRVEGLMEQLRTYERGGPRWRRFSESPSVGIGLLRLLPNRYVRGAVLAGCVLTPMLLVSYGRGMARLAGVVLGIMAFVVFVPPSRERPDRWRRW